MEDLRREGWGQWPVTGTCSWKHSTNDSITACRSLQFSPWAPTAQCGWRQTATRSGTHDTMVP